MNNIVRVMAPVVVLALGAGGYELLDLNKPRPEEKAPAARAVGVFVTPVRQATVDLQVRTAGDEITAPVAG